MADESDFILAIHKVQTAALRSIAAMYFDDPDSSSSADESQYAVEQLALAAKELVTLTWLLPDAQRPVGWEQPRERATKPAESPVTTVHHHVIPGMREETAMEVPSEKVTYEVLKWMAPETIKGWSTKEEGEWWHLSGGFDTSEHAAMYVGAHDRNLDPDRRTEYRIIEKRVIWTEHTPAFKPSDVVYDEIGQEDYLSPRTANPALGARVKDVVNGDAQ